MFQIESLKRRLEEILAAVESKKASDPLALDLRGLSSEADVFFICSGANPRQVAAIAEAIEESLREMGERPLYVEGLNEATWVLIDFGDIIAHVFQEETRRFYRLEDLWGHAPGFQLSPSKSVQTSEG